jgi:hypothetical protein
MLSCCDMTALTVVCSASALFPARVAGFRRPFGVNWQSRKLRIDLQSPVSRSGKVLRDWQEYCYDLRRWPGQGTLGKRALIVIPASGVRSQGFQP